jgi:hypothetical protein
MASDAHDSGRIMRLISPPHARQIRALPHLAKRYGYDQNLDIDGTIDFMTRRYVTPMAQRCDLSEATLADGAAGYGWLSIAFLLRGGREAILIDLDAERLANAQEICRILGVGNRCRFVNRTLQDTGLDNDSVDIFASIETLEHVGRPHVRDSLQEIARITRDLVILTTPNRIFPVVAHDTRLPFAHWLPRPLRRLYARPFGRLPSECGNHFLAPWDLQPLTRKFKPDSRIATFRTLDELKHFYPHYLPYLKDPAHRLRQRPNPLLWRYQTIIATLLSTRSYWLAPNLASVWVRRESA